MEFELKAQAFFCEKWAAYVEADFCHHVCIIYGTCNDYKRKHGQSRGGRPRK